MVEPDKQNACRLPDLTAANEAAAKAQGRGRARLSKGPCMSAEKLSGSWKAFDLTAVPIDETDPSTGHSCHGLRMQMDTTQSLSRSCLLSAYPDSMLCLPCVSCIYHTLHTNLHVIRAEYSRSIPPSCQFQLFCLLTKTCPCLPRSLLFSSG